MRAHTRFPLLLLVGLSLSLAGCNRHSLYDKAIAWERFSAGLVAQEVTVGDLSIAYLTNRDANDGEVLIMLHGFGGNKDNWVRMAGELSENYTIYALDLPGHGDSSKALDLGYRLEDQVGYVHDIVSTLDLGTFHIMGNSMGGAIAALYASRHPDQVQSATLFNPAGVFKYDSELVALVQQGDNPLIISEPGDLERLVDFVMEDKPFVPWPIYEVMEEQALANRPVNERIFQDIRDSGYQNDFRNALNGIRDPVLIVWGKQDRVIDYRNAEVFEERIAVTRTVLLDGIGHVPMIETPDRSAELVRQFISTHPVTAATD